MPHVQHYRGFTVSYSTALYFYPSYTSAVAAFQSLFLVWVPAMLLLGFSSRVKNPLNADFQLGTLTGEHGVGEIVEHREQIISLALVGDGWR